MLGQRNAEWCGHGPVLEEDIALANISLDLIGQSRLLYQHAAALMGDGATEDTLAYFRDASAVPQLHACWNCRTMARWPAPRGRSRLRHHHRPQFPVQRLMLLLWDALQASKDAQLAAIAAKSVKETRYHLRHARDWLVRLGDGTDESHARSPGGARSPDALHPGVLDRVARPKPRQFRPARASTTQSAA